MIVINTSEVSTCIYDYHQVDTSAVFMTIIKPIPLLYLLLSSSRYLCCIYAYHQVDTSPVLLDDSHKYSRGIDLMIVINTAEEST
jgi:hypothetical protein